MSYQPLFLGLGTAVVRTTALTGYLEAETANLTVGQPIVFEASNNSPLVGGLEDNTLHFVKEIIDENNFTVSATLNGPALEVIDDTGFMLVRPIQKENTGESLRKIDTMLQEIYGGVLGGDGVGILSVSSDTSPQLGGNLNLSSFDIVGTGDISITGTVSATNFVGDIAGSVAGNLTGIIDPELGQQDPTISGQKIFALNARDGQSLTWSAADNKWQPGFRLPSYSNAERTAGVWANGDMIYNTDSNKIQGYQNGAWINLDGTV